MKRIIPVLLALSVLWGAVSCGKAPARLHPTVTEEIARDVFMTLSLDRDSYSVGDAVTVTATVENRGDGDVDLRQSIFTDEAVLYGDDGVSMAQRLISVRFMEGGLARNDLLPLRDYVSEEAEDTVLTSGESLTRTVEIFLDGTSTYSAPAAGAEWTVVGGVRIWNDAAESSEYKTAEISVPHDEGEIPTYSVTDGEGRELTAVLGKRYYTAIEDVTADITFTNSGESSVEVYALPDGEFDFGAGLSRRKIYSETDEGELVTPYSPSFEPLRTLGAGESMTVNAVLSAERNELGVLQQIEARDEFILYASVWYKTADGEMQSIAFEMPVPHERTETQIWSEAKGAYFSRLRVTAENRQYSPGEMIPVTLDFFCIREDFYLSPFEGTENKCFRVRLVEDSEVVREVFLKDTPDMLTEGTRLTAETELDTTGMDADKMWSVEFSVISCAEQDMDGRGFEEHSAWLTVPRAGDGSEVIAE